VSTALETEPVAQASPRSTARLAGVFYLLTIIAGAVSAALVGGRLAGYAVGANLISTGCYVLVTLFLYRLFQPVSRRLSLLAAGFSLLGCALGGLAAFHLRPIQLNPLVVFGCYCLLIGYLIWRSTFLPRLLGVLMAVAGLAWLTFLSPTLATSVTPFNLAAGILGEGSLTLWLLAVGVNSRRWIEQAQRAAL
jgi:hypothetical protein